MDLRTYLAREGLGLDDFAKRIDRSLASVSRIARGLQRPDWDTMERICRATNGEVTPNDLAPPGVLPESPEAA
jgi:transcriptional regulator with XRE-family HTH domain